MKIVVAIDSMKESLSSFPVGNIVSRAIKPVFPSCEVSVLPLRTAARGTVEALMEGLHGRILRVDVTGSVGERVSAKYGYVSERQLAVLDIAQVAGLTLVRQLRETRCIRRPTGVEN